MKKQLLSAMIVSSFMSVSAFADSPSNEEQWAELEKKIQGSSQQLASTGVKVDPIAGDFQAKYGDQYTPVTVSGVRFLAQSKGDFLVRPDGAFYIGDGEILPLKDPMIDLDLANMGEKWPSLPLPEGVEKAGDVYVFTDPTCGYCRQFEEGVEQYLNAGIQVNYIPFPRVGVSSPTNQGYQLWAGALCAEDKDVGEKFHELMTDGNASYDVPEVGAECTARLHEGYNYGRQVGVTGTPYIFIRGENGEYAGFNGLVEPSQVASSIGVLIRANRNTAF